MALFKINLEPIPNQVLLTLLSEQVCQITVATLVEGMSLSLLANKEPVVTNILCRNKVNMIPSYGKFKGKLYFEDTVGNSDPSFDGFRSRFRLIYSDVV